MTISTKLLALASASLIAASFMVASAQEGRQRSVTVENSQGRSATSTTTQSVSNGTYTRGKTVDTASGRGYSTTTQAGATDTGRYADRTLTTNSGATVYGSTDAGCVNGVCGRSTEVQGPNGNTAEHNSYRYIDENGNLVHDTDSTGPNGNTTSRQVARDGQGTKSTSVTGPQGQSRSRSRWVRVN